MAKASNNLFLCPTPWCTPQFTSHDLIDAIYRLGVKSIGLTLVPRSVLPICFKSVNSLQFSFFFAPEQGSNVGRARTIYCPRKGFEFRVKKVVLWATYGGAKNLTRDQQISQMLTPKIGPISDPKNGSLFLILKRRGPKVGTESDPRNGYLISFKFVPTESYPGPTKEFISTC